jgi:hypothetical protein
MIIRRVPLTLLMTVTLAAKAFVQMSDPRVGMYTTDSNGRSRLVSLERSYTVAS